MSQVFATSVRDLTLSQGYHAHSTRSDNDDIKKVVGIVLQNKLLENIGHREHKSFPGMKLNPLCKWDVKKYDD